MYTLLITSSILSFLVLLSIILVILLIVFVKFRSDRLFRSVSNFESYVAVLEYHMEKAYTIVYKDKLLIYSVEGMKVNDIEFSAIVKGYALLVLKMLGPTLKEEFCFLYGNEETLLFNIIEFFHSKYESDEIQKSATDKMMNGEDGSMDKIFG